jgi:hypothetical protein
MAATTTNRMLNHFTPEFAKRAEALVNDWKAAGVSAVDAARDLERTCAREREEFAVDGIPLIERVYDGRYDRTTTSFEPNTPEDPNAPVPERQSEAPAGAEVVEGEPVDAEEEDADEPEKQTRRSQRKRTAEK